MYSIVPTFFAIALFIFSHSTSATLTHLECENFPKNIRPADCCPDLMKIIHEESIKSCFANCSNASTLFCCKADCIGNTAGILIDGRFDKTKALHSLTEALDNNTLWTGIVIKHVDECAAECN